MSMTAPPVIVVMAASAGGVRALMTVLGHLPKDLAAAVVVLLHRPAEYESHLIPVLARRTPLPVLDAVPGEPLEPGHVYVARSDRHLTITDAGRFEYSNGHRIRHVLASANPLFTSSATAFGKRVIGVVLTGTGQNGTDGVQAIKRGGGIVIAQNRATSEHFGMPAAAVSTGAVDYLLPLEEIGPTIRRLVRVLTHDKRHNARENEFSAVESDQ